MRMDGTPLTKHLHTHIHLIWPLCNRIWPSAIHQKWGSPHTQVGNGASDCKKRLAAVSNTICRS